MLLKNMAVPLGRQCLRWSTGFTSPSLSETLWYFNSRSVSGSVSSLGRTRCNSATGNEVSLRTLAQHHREGSPVKSRKVIPTIRLPGDRTGRQFLLHYLVGWSEYVTFSGREPADFCGFLVL